jgi:hypothetical protein
MAYIQIKVEQSAPVLGSKPESICLISERYNNPVVALHNVDDRSLMPSQQLARDAVSLYEYNTYLENAYLKANQRASK